MRISSLKLLDNKPIGCKWIFKRKIKTNESIDKYEERVVTKGYKQNECLGDFDT